jgi:2-iminobutanoate/2-iminopropanoate deaminase
MSSSTIRPIATDDAPRPLHGAPYSQAVACAGFIFVSGQLGLDAGEGVFVSGDVAEQTAQALRNVEAILEAAGSGLDRIVKTTVYLSNLDGWPAMNEVYKRIVGKPLAARSAIAVGLPEGALVEIEVIAVADDQARAPTP